MSGVHCYTSFTYSYLSRALVLAETVKLAHPDWTFWALMVDECPEGFDAAPWLAKFDRVIYAKDLGIERFDAWLFKHNIVEACTAVKGHMLCHLLEQGAEKAVYIDPDIAVFHPLTDIIDTLDTRSIVLTPHQVSPNETEAAIRDNEMNSLKYGVFNLGFVAVRSDVNGKAFAQWWARSLYLACFEDVANGIFTDQKWCDLVPALFDNVHVNRDPGCNVASWNISRRPITIEQDGKILVAGSPLKFYHFTKINTAGDAVTDKYAQTTETIEVWNWYKRKLNAVAALQIPMGYWHYGVYSNGEKILPEHRALFRNRKDLFEYFDGPYDVVGNSFFSWFRNKNAAD